MKRTVLHLVTGEIPDELESLLVAQKQDEALEVKILNLAEPPSDEELMTALFESQSAMLW